MNDPIFSRALYDIYYRQPCYREAPKDRKNLSHSGGIYDKTEKYTNSKVRKQHSRKLVSMNMKLTPNVSNCRSPYLLPAF